MASDPRFVQYICDQIVDAGEMSSRKMFGEYAIYSGDKVVALVVDDRLFVRPTSGGRSFIGSPVEAPPYSTTRPHFLIEDRLDDRQWMSELIRITALELSPPKPRPGSHGKEMP